MFEKSFEERLAAWAEFRTSLETSDDPLNDVIEFYRRAPLVSIHTDPWTPSMWPDPWQLLDENQYCDFCTVLGQCFSLQLTDRFKASTFEIHIITDNNLGYRYLLLVDDMVLGYDKNVAIHCKDLPSSLQSHHVYAMPSLQ
jgi:hypothetical protein